MRLPYPGTPEAVLRQPGWSPKAILAREMACLECGRVSSYAAKDVCWEQISPKGHGPGLASIVCWCIEIGCKEELCDLPIEFHLLTVSQKRTEEIRLLLRRLFEKGFFQRLICGRGHAPSAGRIQAVRRVG
jgi:hypothetical protein